ncbi:MAG: serine/threonine-protein kinase [Acidobacteriia bacterium]|nr:serine/threonine-protein kinase [Terriglobia bacterium]
MTSLATGTRLGPYEIQSQIGAGGMGEVYKAVDTRLDRTVAIKVLPPQWAENTEMRQRFEREAQIIASLNHPNICVLHDIGTQDNHSFLVMEYLEGETLASRISQGPVPWEEALQLARAMADALDKAHRRGVIHRDLKPSNVILTESGPKILDFGLAKWKAPKSGSDSISVSQAPTRTDLTTMGSILGTLQYMAPEQLEGVEADARTDIFSFGAVLHEMVTGKKAFEGKSRVLLMSAIATSAPEPLSSVQTEAPRALDHVVKTCLEKDPDERWQTARDLLAELEWIAQAGDDTSLPAPAAAAARWKVSRHFKMLLAAAALLAAVLAVPAVLYFRAPAGKEELRFRIPVSLTAAPALVLSGTVHSYVSANFDVSPDGQALVFSAGTGATATPFLYVRPLGSVTPQLLAGTDGAALPFWSADGRSIGFVASGKLKKIEASGGPPQDICEATNFQGGTWNAEGVIIFGDAQGLFRVSAQGGKPEAITKLGPDETGHFWPSFLPDGRRFLYTIWTQQATRRAIFVGTLGSKDKTRVLAAESNAAYAAPGHLVFHRTNAVYAQRFDPKTLALTGEPVRVADEVGSVNGRGRFAVSPSGVLAYYQGDTAGGATGSSEASEWQLAWVDRGGRASEGVGPQGPYRGMEVSPDGKRVAVHRHEASGGDIWVIEPAGSVTRLTFDASRHNSMPIWSPDGTRIVYSSQKNGKWGLYRTLSTGSMNEELLFESEQVKAPMSWSPDGKRLVFWVQDPKTGGDLWLLPLDGDKKPAPFIATSAAETHGQISADGKWIAYTSNLTGRNEIYIQQFPTGEGRWQISNRGGDWPRWRKDGKELLYHSIGATLDAPAMNVPFVGPILSATVTAKGSTLEHATPVEVVRMTALNLPHSGGDYQTYAISADAQRILYHQVVPSGGAGTPVGRGADPAMGFVVAMNWK